MFDFGDGSILSFHDVDEYFGEKSVESSEKISRFMPRAYKNMSGRPIVFEDIRGLREYEISDPNYYLYNPKTVGNSSIFFKKMKYYEHPEGNVLRSYVLKVGGYLLVEDEEFAQIIEANPIMQKIIEKDLIEECEIEEAKEYYETIKSRRKNNERK